jgi:Flp pilus assembly protein TadG
MMKAQRSKPFRRPTAALHHRRGWRLGVLRRRSVERHNASASVRAGNVGRRRSLARDQSGQSLVEFGLVVPILCLLILGIVDFGKAMNYWHDMTHVANQIARQAAVNSTQLGTTAEECAQLESGELRSGSSHVDPATVTITSTRLLGDQVTVQVSANYHWLPLFGGNWTIRGKATMRLEHNLTTGFTGGTCS